MRLQPRPVLLVVIVFLIIVAAGVSLPFFTLTELIYPVKRDSLFLRSAQLDHEHGVYADPSSGGRVFLYHPAELGLLSVEIAVTTPDNVALSGWYVSDSLDDRATVIVIPDIAESKYDFIMTASEFAGRGLAVCLVDMRMQGESGGVRYSFGRQSVNDVLLLIDTLRSKFGTTNFVLLGNGSGAGIALQAGLDTAVQVVVAQNPYVSLSQYIDDYCENEYGWLCGIFLDRMKKGYERRTAEQIDSVDILAAVRNLVDPALFISYLSEDHLNYKSTGLLYERCASVRKEWLVFRHDYVISHDGERKKYFDRMAAFIRVHLPKMKKVTKYKKLVFTTLTGGPPYVVPVADQQKSP